MPFVPTLSILNSPTGLEEIYVDVSDYAGYGGKSAFTNRTLTLILADGSELTYPGSPNFSFADYPNDTLTVSVSRDYAPLATLSVDSIDLATLTTTTISSISSIAATGGGNVTSAGGGTISAKGVCWNTTGTPTVSDSHTSDGTGTGVFVSSLTGLSASTLYYVRAYATNEAGTSYGNEQSFTSAALSVVLATVAGFDYTAAKNSNSNILYILKVTNNTASSVTITNITVPYLGTFTNADTPATGSSVGYSTTPGFTGYTNLFNIDLPDSPYTASLPISQAIASTAIGYFVVSINVAAGATMGHTFLMNGATNPSVLTITGSPTQVNNQSNISPTITVGV